MTTSDSMDTEPLWLAIERKILDLGSRDLSGGNQESAIQDLARALDEEGFSVSRNAGNMLALRKALQARVSVGHPLMEDLNQAFQALTLDEVKSPYGATVKLIEEVGRDWPKLKDSERRNHILEIVEEKRIELLVAKAKEMEEDGGIRLLIEEKLDPEVIVERMGITQEVFEGVMAAVEAERAERKRVAGLLAGVAEKTEAERIRHLINKDVSEDLIAEMAGVSQEAIDEVNKAMEEEIAEKKRREEEEAARRAAEAAGPALEDIEPDEMLEHIEAVREIMEFSDVEDEIRVMCEQSSVPKVLVDIAISEPDRLDELEAEAEG